MGNPWRFGVVAGCYCLFSILVQLIGNIFFQRRVVAPRPFAQCWANTFPFLIVPLLALMIVRVWKSFLNEIENLQRWLVCLIELERPRFTNILAGFTVRNHHLLIITFKFWLEFP